MNLNGYGTVVGELTDVDTDEVATLVMSLPGVPGVQMRQVLPAGGPIVSVAAGYGGEPALLIVVTADLEPATRRRIRVECAEIEALLTRVDPDLVLPLKDHGVDAAGRPYLIVGLPGPELTGPVPVDEALDALRVMAAGLRLLAAEGLVGPPPAVHRQDRSFVLATPLPPTVLDLLGAGPQTPPRVRDGAAWTGSDQVYAVAARLSLWWSGMVGVPRACAAIVSAGLAHDPDRQLSDVDSFVAALGAAVADKIAPLASVPGQLRALGSRYLLDTLIGRGGTGQVYSALRREDGSRVAAKLLRAELVEDPDVVSRFVRERSVLVGLVHPNLVRVHDLVAEGQDLAIIMDLVDGEDLRRLAARGRLPLRTAANLLAQTADALTAVHAAGLVHRDIKPENVLVATVDGGYVALLSDFGIARAVEGAAGTDLVGTPTYVAPELVAGRPPGPPVDIYALGVTAYQLLVGSPPFSAPSTEALLRAHLDQPVPRPAELDDGAWQILEACLRKDPAARPGAAEVARRWSELAGTSLAAGPVTTAAADGHSADGHSTVEPPGAATIISPRHLAVRPAGSPAARKRRGAVLVSLVTAGVALAGVVIGVGVAVIRPHPPTPVATTRPAANQYPVPAAVSVDASATATLTWSAGAAALPGLGGFVVLDVSGDGARPLTQVLEPTVTSFRVANLRPGRRSCYLVIAVGVRIAPPEPLTQPTCVTPASP